MSQMRLGPTDVARASHSVRAYSLREGPLDAGAPGVPCRKVGPLLVLAPILQRLMLRLRAHGDLSP